MKYNIVVTTLNRFQARKHDGLKDKFATAKNYLFHTVDQLYEHAGLDSFGEDEYKLTIFDSGSDTHEHLEQVKDKYPDIKIVCAPRRLTLNENTNKALRYANLEGDYAILVQDDLYFNKNTFIAMDRWVDSAPKDFSILTLFNCSNSRKPAYAPIKPGAFWGNLFLIFKQSDLKHLMEWKGLRTHGSGHDMTIKDWAKVNSKKIYVNPNSLVDNAGFFSTVSQRPKRRISSFKGVTHDAAKGKTHDGNFVKVGIIITSYNQANYTDNTLQSLAAVTKQSKLVRFFPYVIDDHSTEDVKSIVKKYKFATYVENKGKQGLTMLWNMGYNLVQDCDYLVLCNNDVKFSKGWLEQLVKHMEKLTSFTAAGPVTNAPGHINAQHVSHFFPNYKVNDLQDAINKVGRNLLKAPPQKIVKLNGFCMMFRMSWLKDKGNKPFNENFPIYGAEDDFFDKYKPKTMIVPSSFVFHYKQVSVDRKNFPNQHVRLK